MRHGTQKNPLNEVYLLYKFDLFNFSMTGYTHIFKLVILLSLRSSQLIVMSLTLGKLKLTHLIYIY